LTFREDARSAETGGIRVTVEDPDGCPRYTGTAIIGVRVGPSPEWLASRLRTIGLRPINNVVDATNYVLHELGQPMHAFDLQSLRGAVVVRQARMGESLVTLDGERRALAPGMLLIADATRPIALAGVMGGLDTEVAETTRDVFLECAIFDPRAVRHTRRALGMSTDASYRFERGVDPDGVERAVERAVELLVEVAGGEVVREVASVSARPLEALAIRLRPSRVEQVLGASFTTEQIRTYLEHVGFRVEQGSDGTPIVHVPGHRRYDVFREDDLVEEIARRHGYEAFPDDVRPYRPSSVPPDPMATLEDRLRTLLVGRGFLEARGAAFSPPEEGDVALMLPLSSAESRLRRALVPGMTHRVEANFNRGVRDVRLFELGTAFSPGSGGVPIESTRLAALMTGSRTPVHWSAAPEPLDVWDLKGVAGEIANALTLRLEPIGSEAASAPSWLDTSVGFRFIRPTDAGTAGYAGRMRDGAIDSPAWAGEIWALELDITSMSAPHQPDFRALAAFPAIERDVALIARHELHAATIEGTIRAAAGDLLEDVFVFDVYRGEGLPAGRRSIAFRLRFRAPDRTLTDQEIDEVMNRLLGRLRDEHEVERRA
jgi:phenylalanyl-tRNA synthetase beta chain